MPGPPARRRGKEKGELQKEPPGGVTVEPDDHGLGRSRGGLTTKLHLAVEQGQKLMSIVITAGQRGDSPQFEAVLNKVRVPRLGPGSAGADKSFTQVEALIDWPLRPRSSTTPMSSRGQTRTAS
ncbi:hypothetical protein [Streptomyces gossypiisoli]|uniref:hypothetical protein n=1 Tax=Streptomyces gossypiisoli TaxID=2748864 RepID=UPI0038CD290F